MIEFFTVMLGLFYAFNRNFTINMHLFSIFLIIFNLLFIRRLCYTAFKRQVRNFIYW